MAQQGQEVPVADDAEFVIPARKTTECVALDVVAMAGGEMRRLLSSAVVGLLSVAALGAGHAIATEPIKPHQHFAGRVNGSHNNPVVYTVCPGPMSDGQTGTVAGGQHMKVVRKATAAGRTGLFRQVYAWFVPPSSDGPAPTMIKFSRYGVARSIPTSIEVPCDGPGKVQFSSCPYLAPCAAGFVADIVDVRFVNIAA